MSTLVTVKYLFSKDLISLKNGTEKYGLKSCTDEESNHKMR